VDKPRDPVGNGVPQPHCLILSVDVSARGPEGVRHMSNEAARLGEVDPEAALVSL
jgi:hypothetical protein